MATLQSKYSEPSIFSPASGQRLSSKNYSPARGSLTHRGSERSRSVTSRTHRLRSKQFQISNPDKIIQGLRASFIEQPDALKHNKEISNLREKINETVGDLDRHMLKVLHQQETNFLTAYKGVMRQIAQDLNKYKEELKKYSEESKESENQYLRNTLAVFENEITDLFSITRKFEEQNRELKRKVLDLALDLKSEKELNLTLGKKNQVNQELAKTLYRENRQIIMSTIGNNEKQAREQTNDSNIVQEGEQSHISKGEKKGDSDSNMGSPGMSNKRSSVLITANEYDKRSSLFAEKSTRAIKFDKNPGFKDKMAVWTSNDSSYHSRSISPQVQSDLGENTVLKLSLKALLKPNLKTDVDLDDFAELVMGNIERCLQSRKRTAETVSALSSRENTESVLANMTPRVQEFEYLKSVLGKCLEQTLRKVSITRASSKIPRPKSALKNNSSTREIVELFLQEKEINKIIFSNLESARSHKRTIESSGLLQSQQKNTIESDNNAEDLNPAMRKSSEEELETAAQYFSFADPSNTESKPKIKKLDLEALRPKDDRKDHENNSERPKSSLSYRKNSTGNRGANSYRDHSEREREKKARESLKLTSLLGIKKETRLNTEPDYVSSDPNPEMAIVSGALRSKSPTTNRILIYNGKLYVRNVSPAPSNNIA